MSKRATNDINDQRYLIELKKLFLQRFVTLF